MGYIDTNYLLNNLPRTWKTAVNHKFDSLTPVIWFIVLFSFQLLYIFFWISCENLVLQQGTTLWLMSLSVLILSLPNNVLVLLGEVRCLIYCGI